MRTFALGPRRARRGFTLLEVLVVMIILGVVTTTSMGKMHAVMIQQRLARARTAAQADLEVAYAISVRNRVPIRISWDSTKMQIDVTDRADTTIYQETNLGTEYGLTKANVSFSRNPLEVYPNGLADDSLIIKLTIGNDTTKLHMSRSGMIK